MIGAVLAGIFGLLIGSFLNVCIYRLPLDLSVVRPRSFCPSCERMIAWYDNVPVLSYLILRARCRHCRAPISWRYPLVELMTGALFFGALLRFGPNVAAAKACVFGAALIALIFTDLEERILPDEFTLGGVLAGLVFAAFVPVHGPFGFFLFNEYPARWLSMADSAFAAAFSSGLLWAIGFLYQKLRHKEGLGLGDVKLVAMIGAFLGLEGVLLTLMLGALAGSVTGILYVWLTRKDAATYQLPFGSFLSAAALLVASGIVH